MSAVIKLIISLVLTALSAYWVVSAGQRYMVAQDNLKQAQHDSDVAQAELDRSNQELKELMSTATSNHDGIAKAYDRYQAAQNAVNEEGMH
jgi:multidrug resistance efflux pump